MLQHGWTLKALCYGKTGNDKSKYISGDLASRKAEDVGCLLEDKKFLFEVMKIF